MPVDILIHINWDTFQMEGDFEQGVTFSLSHDTVEPNRVMFGKWDGPQHTMLNRGSVTAIFPFGLGQATKDFRGSFNLDIGGTFVNQDGRLEVTNVSFWLDDIHINFFPDVPGDLESGAINVIEVFLDDILDKVEDEIKEAINSLLAPQ